MTNSKHLTTLNLEPFFRNSIGMPSLFEDMASRLQNANAGNYPPYNIIARNDNDFAIEIAVAGFKEDEIEVHVANNELKVTGLQQKTVADDKGTTEDEGIKYVHRGISSRSFERTFALADYVEVQSATVEHGILTIELQRMIPEALKPKQIEVKHVK